MSRTQKRIRKSIRVGGRLISKVFYSKEAAERWYIDQRHKKIFAESGTPLQLDQTITLNSYFDFEWFPQRKRDFGAATWKADLQRFNDYFRKNIGRQPIAQVTMGHARQALSAMTVELALSTKTRDRARALLSSIFKAALNRDEPLVKNNPVTHISFGRVRAGDVKQHEPKALAGEKQIGQFLGAAKALGPDAYLWALLAVRTGLRSSEICGLRWGSVDFEHGVIHVRERYLASERRVGPGTKAGKYASRIVPMMHAELVSELVRAMSRAHPEDSDFVLARRDGSHWNENQVKRTCQTIADAAGASVTPHGLRHTFAREFLSRNGDMDTLQQILGHASKSMTQHYSKLQLEHLKKYAITQGAPAAHLKVVENE